MLTVVDRKAFSNAWVNIRNGRYVPLERCVWYGPKKFPSKPLLHSIYGHELDLLFRQILGVPNVTSAEAREYLQQLRGDKSTTMSDVDEVYM